jgi:hypothetical protein
VPTVLKSESLNILETSGPVHVCNGIALLFFTFVCGWVGGWVGREVLVILETDSDYLATPHLPLSFQLQVGPVAQSV